MDGRYTYRMDRICVCGHLFGEHAAVRTKVEGRVVQPCFHEGDDPCECEAFRKARA